MGSQFKKAHRTHAFAQPAGVPYPSSPTASADTGAPLTDERLLERFAELCALVPDEVERARLLGISSGTDAAWRAGRALPLLRARRKALERALRSQ